MTSAPHGLDRREQIRVVIKRQTAQKQQIVDQADQLAESKSAEPGDHADEKASPDMRMSPNRVAPTRQPGNAPRGPSLG